MQHEFKTVKATTKKYKTKDGIKESISKRLDLGVDSIFAVGDEVAITFKSDFESLGDDSAVAVAERDATIDKLNDSVGKYKRELKEKTDIIAATSKEIKALKTKVAELESDISKKDETIGELSADVTAKDEKLTDSGKTIDGLNDKVDKLNATVDELKPLLLSKDAAIEDYKVKLAKYDDVDISALKEKAAKYDAADVDDLKDKAAELDKAKNVIMKLQNEKIEYIQLVNYHKETATAYKNQGLLNKALGRDAAAEITAPTLVLIDSSGNAINEDDADKPDDAATDDGN